MSRERTRILIVDDEEGNRDLLRRRLERDGYAVVAASGGREVLAAVARGEADAPDIDGRVFVRVPQRGMSVGWFARVKIVGHTDYDLIAEPA